MIHVVFTVASLLLLVFALVDVIRSEDWQIKHLPKMAWILIIIFLPLIGSILWLVIGKDRGEQSSESLFRAAPRHDDRPLRRETLDEHLTDDERIEREIAFHERQAEIRRLEAEVRAKRAGSAGE